MEQQPRADSRDEAVEADDSCCGPGSAHGASADTDEMQGKVQTHRSREEYRNAGFSYTAARSLVVMKQQSMETWARRERLEAVPEPSEPVWSLARWERSTSGRGSVSRARTSCKQIENEWELQLLQVAKLPEEALTTGICEADQW